MLLLQQWVQNENFSPDNPEQARFENYFALPGGYVSTYYDQLPVTGGTLMNGPVDVITDTFKSNWKLLAVAGLALGALIAIRNR